MNSLTFSASSGGALPPGDDIASLPPKVQKLYWLLGNLALGTNAMSQAAKDNCGYYQYLIRTAREQGDMAALTQHIQAAERYVNALIIAGNERRAKAERLAREQRHQGQVRQFREADAQGMENDDVQQQRVNLSGGGGGGKYQNLSRAVNPLLFGDFMLPGRGGDGDVPPPPKYCDDKPAPKTAIVNFDDVDIFSNPESDADTIFEHYEGEVTIVGYYPGEDGTWRRVRITGNDGKRVYAWLSPEQFDNDDDLKGFQRVNYEGERTLRPFFMEDGDIAAEDIIEGCASM